MRRIGMLVVAVSALVGAFLIGSATAATASVPAFDHVFLIVMENHSFAQVVGSASAPYENSLAAQYGLATNYHAVTHPSVNNYLALLSGQTYATVPPAVGTAITDSCTPTATSCSSNAPNLADRIEASGRTWRGYMEDMPSACYGPHDNGLYTERHNPFPYFNQIRTNAARCARTVPYTQLATDLKSGSTTPSFAWITPNLCNDMHNCSIATGDAWLKANVPLILNSPAYTAQNSLVVITFDENDGSAGNQVETLMLSKSVPAGFRSAVDYTHYSLLKTIESAWGLPTLTANDAAASPMSDFFGGSVVAGSPTPTRTATLVPSPTNTPTPASSPIRAAFLYPWFPSAWSQLGVDPYTNYHPLLGRYDSSDDALIYAQLLLAERAHLDAFISSWWGQGTVTDSALQHIVPRAQADGSPLKWAIYYEPEGQGNPSVTQIVSDLQYLGRTLFKQPNYLTVGGKPVVFVYGDAADNAATSTRWAQAKAQLGGNLYVVLKVHSGYRTDPDQPDSWHQYGPASAIDKQLPYSVSVSPGFWKVGETPRLARDPTTFATNVAAMVASGAQWDLITTWNEWGEGTSIEPASEFGTQYLDILGQH